MSSPKKDDQDTTNSYKWRDTAGYSHRFSLGNANSVNIKQTWTLLLITAFAISLMGVVFIIFMPPKEKEPFARFSVESKEPMEYTFVDNFSLQESKPLIWAPGINNTFWVADEVGLSCYDTTGNQLSSWKFYPQTPENEKISADVQPENKPVETKSVETKSADTKPAETKSVDTKPADTKSDDIKTVTEAGSIATKEVSSNKTEIKKRLPTALCVVPYSDSSEEDPSVSSSLIYIAFRNIIAVLTTEQKGNHVSDLIQLKADVSIQSMMVFGHWLFLADGNGKVILRYDLNDLKQAMKIGEVTESSEFPGFTLPSSSCFALGFDKNQKHLLVTNPIRFRIEAFDAETGNWKKEYSWDRQPGQEKAFSGSYNPVYLSVFSNGDILTVERGKVPRIKIFDRQGNLRRELTQIEKDLQVKEESLSFPLILENDTILVFNQEEGVNVYKQELSPETIE